MSIYKILSDKNDSRTNGVDSRFNGYLEDYLSTVAEDELDPVIHEAFAVIRDEDPETKICVGLRTDVNDSAISNQIIRYKDIAKLSGKPIVYPYIVYGEKNGQERALIVMPAGKCNYIYAKGLYYCMTEPGSEFIDCKMRLWLWQLTVPRRSRMRMRLCLRRRRVRCRELLTTMSSSPMRS